MNWLTPLVLMLQPAEGSSPPAAEGEAPPADPQEAANQAAETAATTGLTPAEATDETLRRFNSFDAFFRTDNLIYLWEVYGIPAVKALIIFTLAWFVASWIKQASELPGWVP